MDIRLPYHRTFEFSPRGYSGGFWHHRDFSWDYGASGIQYGFRSGRCGSLCFRSGRAFHERSVGDHRQGYTLTLTPTVGNAVSFSQISFYAWGNSGINAESYSFFVRSDQTGTTTLGTFTQALKLANGTSPSGTSQFSIDLSSIAELQNVSSATTFTIGVYVTGPPASPTNLGGNLRIDSIQLDGTVSAIPEPLSPLISGLGLGLMAIRRRR